MNEFSHIPSSRSVIEVMRENRPTQQEIGSSGTHVDSPSGRKSYCDYVYKTG